MRQKCTIDSGRIWLAAGLGLSSCLLLATACELVFDPQLDRFDSEFSDTCVENTDCASGICREERCTKTCTGSGSGPCSENSVCQAGYCDFTSPPPLKGPPKIAFLYNGKIQEHGIIKAHDDSRQYVEDHVTGSTTLGQEDVTASKAAATIDSLVSEGYNVIVGTSSDFQTAAQNGALNHSGSNFLMYGVYSGFEAGPNLGSYMGRMYQVMYMMGALTGYMTRTLRVGIVAPVGIPETVRNINAFARGFFFTVEDPNGSSTEPNPAVIVRWINAWTNESLEQTATRELVEDGRADIILGYTESTVPLVTAASMQVVLDPETEETGDVWVIGYGNPDVCNAAPSRCLSAAYWNFGTMLKRTVDQMVTGTWTPAVVWEQIDREKAVSPVYFAEFNTDLVSLGISFAVTDDILDDLAQDSDNGRMLPFRGSSVRDTSGTPRSVAGDEDLLEMCWFVEGIFEIDNGTHELVAGVVPTSCRGER